MVRRCYRTKAAEIHQANIDAGWWKLGREQIDIEDWITVTIPRNIGELLCLVHSEIDEAYHGHRFGLFDDHLPDLLMSQVEMADTAIRVYDMIGYFEAKSPGAVQPDFYDFPDIDFRFARICMLCHGLTSEAMEYFRKSNELLGVVKLWHLLDALYITAEKFGFDLDQVIERKLEYNRNRADHKLENRAQPGGKTF